MKPLFLVLARKPYDWFKKGHKKYELREEKIKYNRDMVISGRKVIVQKNQKNEGRFTGKIGKVKRGSLKYILNHIPYKQIIPVAKSKNEAVDIITKAGYIKNQNNCIAFEIKR